MKAQKCGQKKWFVVELAIIGVLSSRFWAERPFLGCHPVDLGHPSVAMLGLISGMLFAIVAISRQPRWPPFYLMIAVGVPVTIGVLWWGIEQFFSVRIPFVFSFGQQYPSHFEILASGIRAALLYGMSIVLYCGARKVLTKIMSISLTKSAQ